MPDEKPQDAKPAAPKTKTQENFYDLAEQGWAELIAAVEKIQSAANKLKKSARPIDGYDIQKAVVKHKPELMTKHLEALRAHRKENDL
jgi:diadenosine tetraphosphate (Ap4A) HIT family hydrolase